MPEKTPLYDVTAAAGATFIEEAGWLVPEHFGDPASEYRETRDGAVVFDVSHRGKLHVTGSEAARFLHNMCTNDVLKLADGAVREAFFCTAKARVVGHVWIHCVSPPDDANEYDLNMAPGQNTTVLKYLDHFLISEDVQFADRTRELAQVHVAGPKAQSVLEAAGLMTIRNQILPTVPLSVPGRDVLWWPWDQASMLWERLVKAGARPAGMGTYHTLRVEAGTPMFGPDIDENRLVMEVGRTAQAICYTKGCYLGQEPIVMARDRGHVNRMLLGLKLDGNAVAPHGAKVFRDGTEIGQTMSSALSPRLGSIALVYLRRGSWEPGTGVEVETSTGRIRAAVSGLPFGG
jgi:tRNA-modifying protein YgfZ